MTVKPETRPAPAQFLNWYGDGGSGAAPTAAQWRRLVDWPADTPITLVNLFKFRDTARYEDGRGDGGSGQDAFARYAEVSMPTMERVGGRFLLVGPYQGPFLGSDEGWDLIAIGQYPTVEACLALYADPEYRVAFHHRTAACARQTVMICGG